MTRLPAAIVLAMLTILLAVIVAVAFPSPAEAHWQRSGSDCYTTYSFGRWSRAYPNVHCHWFRAPRHPGWQ